MEGDSKFIGFYNDRIHEIITDFPSVFDQNCEENEGGEGETGDGENDRTDKRENKGFDGFSYLSLIKRYSDTTKEKWSDVYEVNIYYFLNIVSFSISWDKKEADYIKKLRMK